MIARRKLTPVRFFYLGTLVLLVFLLLLFTQHHPVDLRVLNPVYFLPRLLQANRPLSVSSSDQTLPRQRSGSKKCNLYTLNGRKSSQGEGSAVSCRRALPVPGSCEVADKLFHSSPPGQCDSQASVEFCSLRSSGDGHVVQCGHEQCASSLLGGTVDADTGQLQWKKFRSSQELEEWISSLLQPSSGKQKHFGFCMVGCGNTWSDDDDGGLYDQQNDTDVNTDLSAIQILLLPPQLRAGHVRRPPSHLDINFNLIFIDSLSRQHFFRSLPSTVKLFEDLTKSNTSKVNVFDFELVQAVRSRTFETIQMLFSGEVDPSVKPFGVLELPPEPLKTEALLKTLKKRGYSTLWLEDLCYLWEWGISKDLLVHNKTLTAEQTWKALQQALLKGNIDSLEATYAMCKVLSENGVPDHFHGPDVVCLNGRHQHDYLLDYLELYQHTMVKAGKPFFTFVQTNVGHEDSGRRVQTLDLSLQRYLKNVLQLKDTLTIIFSDHGNSYGAFMEKSMEGRVELFHPHLFILVPDSVATVLGPDAMKALHVNQHRLISHLDLHYTLQSLASNHQNRVSEKHMTYNVSSEGLLSVVSSSRSCDQIPRIMPNLCICQNFDMPADSDGYHALFAHMAVGKINNEIQGQFFQQAKQSNSKHTQGFGHCRRLTLGDFSNVRKSFSGTTISLKMDLLVPLEDLGGESVRGVDEFEEPSQEMEIFFVSMVVELGGGNSSRPRIFLETLDRITPYSKFSVCADPTVRLELCVCDINQTHKSTQDIEETSVKHSLYTSPDVFTAKGTQGCLQLITRKNKDGGVFSVANVCVGKVYEVLFSLQTSEMIVSDPMPRQEQVFPGQEIFLCMAVKNAPRANWNWSFTLHHRHMTL